MFYRDLGFHPRWRPVEGIPRVKMRTWKSWTSLFTNLVFMVSYEMTRSEFSVYIKIKIQFSQSRHWIKIVLGFSRRFIFSDDDVDLNIRRTSTPVKAQRKLSSQFDQPSNEDGVKGDKNRRRGPKHNLTPGSKQNANQPKSCTCRCRCRNQLFIMKTP